MTVKELLRQAYAAGEERRPDTWDGWWLDVGVNLQIEFLHSGPPKPAGWISENGQRRLLSLDPPPPSSLSWPVNVSLTSRTSYPCPIYLDPPPERRKT